jgi:hypothetical protein
MKRLLWIPLLVFLVGRAWAQATPTATPTPTGPPTCSVTGQVKNADGSPFVNGTIQFNSKNIQVVNGIVINPTLVTTNTDGGGNIRAISIPQLLVMQVTICPPATGQGQPSGCSAPFSVIIPNTSSVNFGNLSTGTMLVQPLPPPGAVGQVLGSNSNVASEWETLSGGVGECTLQWISAGNYQMNCPGYEQTLTPTYPLGVTVGGTGSDIAPTVNQILVASSATAYSPVTAGGDLTNVGGVFTVHSIGGVAGPFLPVAGPTFTGTLSGPKLNLTGIAPSLTFSGIAMGGVCPAGQWVSTLSNTGVPTCTATPPPAAGSITDAMLAGAYSGIGACTAGQFVSTLNRAAAPTCTNPPTGYPNGVAPQIAGFSATANVAEAETLSGDATLARASAGSYVITVSKLNGVAVGALATLNVGTGLTASGGNLNLTTPVSVANGGRGSSVALTAGQIDIAQSATAMGAVAMSGDATITSAGVISVTKTGGVAFSALATAAVPLSVALGGTGSTTVIYAPLTNIAGGSHNYAPLDSPVFTTALTLPTGIVCTGGQVLASISATLTPTCVATSGGSGFPSGGPPQLAGYSATNVAESETISGDATLTRAGANSYTIAVTATNSVAFTGLATAAIPLSIANGGTGQSSAASSGVILVGQSATAFGIRSVGGDATMTNTGALTVTKTAGVAFSALATATVPLSVANGGTGSTTVIYAPLTNPTNGQNNYAPLANASLTGVPLAPTATVGTNTTQIATTAFVLANAPVGAPLVNPTNGQNNYAPLNNPTFTGTLTASVGTFTGPIQSTNNVLISNGQFVYWSGYTAQIISYGFSNEDILNNGFTNGAGNYYAYATSVAGIHLAGSSINFDVNTGLTGGGNTYTPTTVATIDTTGINLPTGETYKINGASISGLYAPITNPAGGSGNYLPISGPTWTGTATGPTLTVNTTETFPDASTATSAGLNSVKALGVGIAAQTVGTSPTLIEAENDNNGTTNMVVVNKNAGASAQSVYYLYNDHVPSTYAAFGYTSSGFTAFPPTANETAWLATSGAGGLVFDTRTAAPIKFFVADAATASLSASGLNLQQGAYQVNGAQITSANLSDTASGTWTPTLNFGGSSAGITYAGNNGGTYSKVGKSVTVNFALYTTSIGTATGNANMCGLPVAAASVGGGQGWFTFSVYGGMTGVNLPVLLSQGQGSCIGFWNTSNGGNAPLSQANFTASMALNGTFTYLSN